MLNIGLMAFALLGDFLNSWAQKKNKNVEIQGKNSGNP